MFICCAKPAADGRFPGVHLSINPGPNWLRCANAARLYACTVPISITGKTGTPPAPSAEKALSKSVAVPEPLKLNAPSKKHLRPAHAAAILAATEAGRVSAT